METWTLEHPTHGRITVECGFDAEFIERYPDWPAERDEETGEVAAGTPLPVDAGAKERLLTFVSNPPVRLQVSVGGQVRRRLRGVQSGKIPLSKKLGSDLEPAGNLTVMPGKAYVKIYANFFDELKAVEFREGKQVVEFTPPPGSRGEKRAREMEESSFKRVLYPMLGGLGKSGWAIAVIVLGPLVSRLIGWLLDQLPDWELPDWQLPAIALPVPNLPDITLPVPAWPDWDIPFPDLTIPAWLEFLLEYTKVWVPLVIAVVLGVMAVRNHRKSEAEKRRWESGEDETRSPSVRGG